MSNPDLNVNILKKVEIMKNIFICGFFFLAGIVAVKMTPDILKRKLGELIKDRHPKSHVKLERFKPRYVDISWNILPLF